MLLFISHCWSFNKSPHAKTHSKELNKDLGCCPGGRDLWTAWLKFSSLPVRYTAWFITPGLPSTLSPTSPIQSYPSGFTVFVWSPSVQPLDALALPLVHMNLASCQRSHRHRIKDAIIRYSLLFSSPALSWQSPTKGVWGVLNYKGREEGTRVVQQNALQKRALLNLRGWESGITWRYWTSPFATRSEILSQ